MSDAGSSLRHMYLNVYAILVYSLVKSVLSLSTTCTLTASRYRYAQSRLINPLILHASRLLLSVTSALMHALPASPNVVMRLVQLIIYSVPGIFSNIRWLRTAYSCRNLSLEQIFFIIRHIHFNVI